MYCIVLYCNIVNRELKKSKKNYYANYFSEHVNNIKKTWDGIKKIINAKKTNKTSQVNIGGKITDNDKQIATNFNHFFVNVGPSTKESIPKVPNISPSKFLKNHNKINFVIAHVSNEEILDIINTLENKITGTSSIPLKMLSNT